MKKLPLSLLLIKFQFITIPCRLRLNSISEDQKLNYKNAVDGLARIIKEEGASKLFRGVEWSIQRAALLSIGQIAFYDNTKNFLLRTGYFHDNVPTHLTASCLAGTVATFLTQPYVDIDKMLLNHTINYVL